MRRGEEGENYGERNKKRKGRKPGIDQKENVDEDDYPDRSWPCYRRYFDFSYGRQPDPAFEQSEY